MEFGGFLGLVVIEVTLWDVGFCVLLGSMLPCFGTVFILYSVDGAPL